MVKEEKRLGAVIEKPNHVNAKKERGGKKEKKGEKKEN